MPELNVPNRTLFHGDNLPFLRGLNSESVHLIATPRRSIKDVTFTQHRTAWRAAQSSRTAGFEPMASSGIGIYLQNQECGQEE